MHQPNDANEPSEPNGHRLDLMQRLWRLPFELRAIVYAHAGIATLFLHGLLPMPLDRRSLSLLWADTIANNLLAVVPRLPPLQLSWELLFLRPSPSPSNMLTALRLHPLLLAGVAHLLPSLSASCPSTASTSTAAPVPPGIAIAALSPSFLMTALKALLDMLAPATLPVAHSLLQTVLMPAIGGLHSTAETAPAPANRDLAWNTLDFAAALGRLDVVQAIHRAVPDIASFYAFHWAGKYNHLDVLQFLADHGLDRFAEVAGAIEGGALDAVKFIYTRYRSPPPHHAVRTAIQRSHHHVLVWLLETDPRLASHEAFARVKDDCAEFGNVEFLAYACTNGIGSTSTRASKAMDLAATHGRLEMLVWLHLHYPHGCTRMAMDAAASMGHMDVVRWLHLNRQEGCSQSAMNTAAAHGNFHMVVYLHENRTEGCTAYAVDRAAGNGHTAVVRFLLENRTEGFTEVACTTAASNGHLGIVQMLFEHSRGRWRQHAEYFDDTWVAAIEAARRFGYAPIVEWLVERLDDHRRIQQERLVRASLSVSTASGSLLLKRRSWQSQPASPRSPTSSSQDSPFAFKAAAPAASAAASPSLMSSFAPSLPSLPLLSSKRRSFKWLTLPGHKSKSKSKSTAVADEAHI
ncbi:ankyrin repeat-containing domain protein [Entophlyctis helioformis]|nr:ankyrin repeat-containing domain protein [Entophlyctis helioformis]